MVKVKELSSSFVNSKWEIVKDSHDLSEESKAILELIDPNKKSLSWSSEQFWSEDSKGKYTFEQIKIKNADIIKQIFDVSDYSDNVLWLYSYLKDLHARQYIFKKFVKFLRKYKESLLYSLANNIVWENIISIKIKNIDFEDLKKYNLMQDYDILMSSLSSCRLGFNEAIYENELTKIDLMFDSYKKINNYILKKISKIELKLAESIWYKKQSKTNEDWTIWNSV